MVTSPDSGMSHARRPRPTNAHRASQGELNWLAILESQPDLSIRGLAKLTNVQPKQIREWRQLKERLKVTAGCRRRLNGGGHREKWPLMERAVYRQFLAHRAKGLAVSVSLLRKWASQYMKHRQPTADFRASARWTFHYRVQWSLAQPPSGWRCQREFDSYKGHLTESVGQTLNMFKVARAVIPGGRTPLVQLLGISINRSFKCGVRHRYSTWFEEVGIGQTTRAGNLKKPPPEVIVKWIVESWADVPEELAEVEVLEDVLEEEEDGEHPNPFYEDLLHAPEPPATKDDEAEDEEEGLAGEEDVVDAAAEEGDGMAPDEEGGEADAEMGGADEWSEDGDDWWAAGRYEGEEVEEWIAGKDD
ncbi:unnamed protein product [Closterium sp. NIES-53]